MRLCWLARALVPSSSQVRRGSAHGVLPCVSLVFPPHSPGTIVGFKRGIQRSVKLPAPGAPVAAVDPRPKSSSDAFAVAVKALAYGTALCIGGSGLVAVGTGMALGVKNVRVPAF